MASIHTATRLVTFGAEVALVGCRFFTNAALDPATVVGRGCSVTYSGSGVWVATLPLACHKVIALTLGRGSIGNVHLGAVIGNEGSGGLTTVTITSSGGADIAAGDDNWISLLALCEGIPGGS